MVVGSNSRATSVAFDHGQRLEDRPEIPQPPGDASLGQNCHTAPGTIGAEEGASLSTLLLELRSQVQALEHGMDHEKTELEAARACIAEQSHQLRTHQCKFTTSVVHDNPHLQVVEVAAFVSPTPADYSPVGSPHQHLVLQLYISFVSQQTVRKTPALTARSGRRARWNLFAMNLLSFPQILFRCASMLADLNVGQWGNYARSRDRCFRAGC